jgi:hypothetical protein
MAVSAASEKSVGTKMIAFFSDMGILLLDLQK